MRPRRAPPAHISTELFRQFRSPRRGSGNPEVMTNPVWVWLIEQGLSAYSANETFHGSRSEDAGPCWSWDRYGRSETALPDGRVIRIGGEHEDSYDPNFYIYNDVVMSDPGGRIEIFGYSEEAFPPTDFHTANLVGERIIIIGNLSYPGLRQERAQVLAFDANRYVFNRIAPDGVGPSWLHKHSADLVDDGRALLVRGGLVDNPKWTSLVENIDDWRLDLDAWRWDRLTHRAWPRFAFVRADGAPNHLYWLRDHIWARASNRPDRFADRRAERLRGLGPAPRLDLLKTLYSPDILHSQLPEIEGEYRIHRLSIDGVTVRYVEGDYDVTLTVEGNLPKEIVDLLRADLLGKLGAIENTQIDCTALMVD